MLNDDALGCHAKELLWDDNKERYRPESFFEGSHTHEHVENTTNSHMDFSRGQHV